jgi:hypothetical protein
LKLNLITRRTSRAITTGDWKKLAQAGDFDSMYLHLKDDEPGLAEASAFHLWRIKKNRFLLIPVVAQRERRNLASSSDALRRRLSSASDCIQS